MKKIIFGFILPVLTFALYSCEDLQKTQLEWADPEENVFVGKLDSVEVHSGFNRVEISGQTTYIRTAVTCEVIFDIEHKEQKIVKKISDIDSGDGYAKFIIEDLPRGSYYFNVTCYDSHHNKSLTSKVFGTVYGDVDIKMCKPKRIVEILPQMDGSVNLIWGAPVPSGLTVKYENKRGKMEDIDVLPTDSRTIVKDWKLGGKIIVDQYYKLFEEDIDILPLETETYTFPTKIETKTAHWNASARAELGTTSVGGDYNLMNGLTIEMRVKIEEFAKYSWGDYIMQTFISNWGGPVGFMFQNIGKKLEVYTWPNWGHALSGDVLELNKWYHVAFTMDEGTKQIIIYLDGTPVATGGFTTMQGYGKTMLLGTFADDASRRHYGWIDNVSIWTRPLNAEAIKLHADNKGVLDVSVEKENGLEAYWPMNNNYGKSVQDMTGSHNGTFIGIDWE